ncbi:MAG TPA: sugar transferase [Gemmatimonadaceae bacterium]|nr:sugar transferase [Gemmatimonadaceae bacterium]
MASQSAVSYVDTIPQTPPLEVRARLWERRPDSVRRHAARVVSRTGILMIGDLTALLAARSLMRAVLAVAAPNGFQLLDGVGPLAAPGRPGSLVFAPALILALALTGAYSRQRRLNGAVRLAGAVMLAGLATVVVTAAAVGVQQALAGIAVVAALVWAALAAARFASEWFLRSVWPRDRHASVAVLAGPPHAMESEAAVALCAPGSEYTVGARYTVDRRRTDVHALRSEVRSLLWYEDAEALVLCDAVPEKDVRALLDAAIDADCLLLYPARALTIEGVRPRLVWHHDRPFLELGAPMLRPHAVVTKRIVDVIGGTMLMIVTAPVMLLIALAIKLDSPGDVFFAQNRAGLGGRGFRMLKFRTMCDGADDSKNALAHLNHTGDRRLFKIPADPRVTRIGKFLRRWSLDELPQLINVLRGQMSLVGPRPFFEADFDAYEDHHFRRIDTKPGLTGLWQVSGRSDVVDFEDVVFLDKQYIEQWSFWLDVSILFRTVSAVFRRTGAY